MRTPRRDQEKYLNGISIYTDIRTESSKKGILNGTLQVGEKDPAIGLNVHVFAIPGERKNRLKRNN